MSCNERTLGRRPGCSVDTQTDIDSLLAYILRMYDDNYQPVSVYPTGGVGTTVVSDAVAWTPGALAEVVPAATITSDFLVKRVTIETLNIAAGTFELVLYSGAADSEVARTRFSVVGGFFGNTVFDMPSVLVTANSRIRAVMMCSAGAATATISIAYRPLAI